MNIAKKDNLPKQIAGTFLSLAKALMNGQQQPDLSRIITHPGHDDTHDCFFEHPNTVLAITVGIGVFDADMPHNHTHLFWETRDNKQNPVRFYGVYDDETISKGKLNRFDLYMQSGQQIAFLGIDYHDDGRQHLTPQIARTIDYRGDDYLDNAIKSRFLVDASNPHHALLSKEGTIRHIMTVMGFDQQSLDTVRLDKASILESAPIRKAQLQTQHHNFFHMGLRTDHPDVIAQLAHDAHTPKDLAQNILGQAIRMHARRGLIAVLSWQDDRLTQMIETYGTNISERAHQSGHNDICYIIARDGRFPDPEDPDDIWGRGVVDRALGRVRDGADIPEDIRIDAGIDLTKWRTMRSDNRKIHKRHFA